MARMKANHSRALRAIRAIRCKKTTSALVFVCFAAAYFLSYFYRFKLNTQHTQPAPIGAIHDLPEKQRARPERSRAATFYREFFCRIDEQAFAVLFSQEPSCPNAPVNVLVGLAALTSGFGRSDEELCEQFLYNLQE
ncbi:MAG: hypothetical protein RMK99_12805 [Anaerolineales bacterium]|nr:hypothetical protein [Anaerolineales bacterium]